MKIIAIRQARAIWIIPPYFLNPKGAFIRPSLEALKGRYHFQKSPLDTPPPGGMPNSADAAKYENGAFDGKDGKVIIVSFIIHGDGFVVETRSSTNDGDSFLEDAFGWVAKEHGLPSLADLPIKKMYTSEINFTFDKPAKFFNSKLASFFKEVSVKMGGDDGEKLDFLTFQVATDQTTAKRQLNFRIDREVNTKIEDGRLYSFATCTTDVHLKLLEKLESLL